MAVSDQDIIDLYTQALGRAPDPSVVSSFSNDINNNGKTLTDLANTLGAFRQDTGNNQSFLKGGSFDNTYQNVIDQANRDTGLAGGTVVNRGSFGDPLRTAIVGSGDHAG